MDATYHVSQPTQTFALVRLGLSLLGNCRAALLEWHQRRRVAARLLDMSDRDLQDIGISRGEVDFVAANRSLDPRSAVNPTA